MMHKGLTTNTYSVVLSKRAEGWRELSYIKYVDIVIVLQSYNNIYNMQFYVTDYEYLLF